MKSTKRKSALERHSSQIASIAPGGVDQAGTAVMTLKGCQGGSPMSSSASIRGFGRGKEIPESLEWLVKESAGSLEWAGDGQRVFSQRIEE